jgi:hypothetical protein
MSKAYSSEFFTIRWLPNSIYLSVKCRAQGCPFRIEFYYDSSCEFEQHTDLRLVRTATTYQITTLADSLR